MIVEGKNVLRTVIVQPGVSINLSSLSLPQIYSIQAIIYTPLSVRLIFVQRKRYKNFIENSF